MISEYMENFFETIMQVIAKHLCQYSDITIDSYTDPIQPASGMKAGELHAWVVSSKEYMMAYSNNHLYNQVGCNISQLSEKGVYHALAPNKEHKAWI